jgi:protein-L-isoaspartate(D-aspartate) O-methyltransferase
MTLDVLRAAALARARQTLTQLRDELLHAVAVALEGRVGGIDVRLERYHPQQSVLKPQDGHRQTACMRYISAPQRSQSVFASPLGAADRADLSGVIGRAGGRGPSGSDMEQIMSWIDEQLVARGIRDPRVLDAMQRVPREAFVPAASREQAYFDRALPIACGQTISQPFMVAVMTEALALDGGERVLEIGTGSGYQTAVLAQLAREVISIERWPELADGARATLAALGYTNISLVVGDGTLGWPSAAPFDRILVAAGAPRVPDTLQQQLVPAGGRLVIPVGPPEQQRIDAHRTGRRGLHPVAARGVRVCPAGGRARLARAPLSSRFRMRYVLSSTVCNRYRCNE